MTNKWTACLLTALGLVLGLPALGQSNQPGRMPWPENWPEPQQQREGAGATSRARSDNRSLRRLLPEGPAVAGLVSVSGLEDEIVAVPVISGFAPEHGVAGTSVVIIGERFSGASKVTFAGVETTGFTVNSEGTQISAVVPPGAFSGTIAVTTSGGTGISAHDFGVDLVIGNGSSPVLQKLPGGAYHDITVMGSATASITGPTYVTGTFRVKSGGVLEVLHHPLMGPGSFTMEPLTLLSIGDRQGISLSGPQGAIQVSGTRTFSSEAAYHYGGSVAQQTGTGLPASVLYLIVDNAAGVDLTQDVAVRRGLELSAAGGDLRLGDHDLTLVSDATGTVQVVNGPGRVVSNGSGQAHAPTWGRSDRRPESGYRPFTLPAHAPAGSDLATDHFTP